MSALPCGCHQKRRCPIAKREHSLGHRGNLYRHLQASVVKEQAEQAKKRRERDKLLKRRASRRAIRAALANLKATNAARRESGRNVTKG